MQFAFQLQILRNEEKAVQGFLEMETGVRKSRKKRENKNYTGSFMD